MLAVCWPYVGRMLAVCLPCSGRMLAVCWPYVGRILAVCWPYVGRMLAIPNRPISPLQEQRLKNLLFRSFVSGKC